MDTGSVGDVADHLASLRIDDDDMGPMAHIQAMRGRVDREIVPPPIAADRDLFREVVRTVLGFPTGHCQTGDCRHRECVSHHVLLLLLP